MNGQVLDVVVAGVGGQGTVMLAKMIGKAAFRANVPVLTRETIGGFQRFGNVVVEIRLGAGALSNTIDYGSADVVVGMELLQALRYGIRYLKPNGVAIVNARKVFKRGSPRAYSPEVGDVVTQLREISPRVYAVDGPGLAQKAGNPRMENMVMLGSLAGANILPIPTEVLAAEILATAPAGTGAANVRAFDLGAKAIGSRDAAAAASPL
jgi:indolepyruvate ferredoxin oxidoreductase, beta subunit